MVDLLLSFLSITIMKWLLSFFFLLLFLCMIDFFIIYLFFLSYVIRSINWQLRIFYLRWRRLILNCWCFCMWVFLFFIDFELKKRSNLCNFLLDFCVFLSNYLIFFFMMPLECILAMFMMEIIDATIGFKIFRDLLCLSIIDFFDLS